MEYLHAYWRLAYIKDKNRKDCGSPFVDLLAMDDKEALIVHRGEYNFIVLNKYPYNAGHLLILPVREVPELEELEENELQEHMRFIIKAKDILTRALEPHGFNVGYNFGVAAGAGIPGHLHCHIVPRWDGDNNFMPVLGQTRVLPAALEEMWEQLRKFA